MIITRYASILAQWRQSPGVTAFNMQTGKGDELTADERKQFKYMRAR